jgi:hypothetical protein
MAIGDAARDLAIRTVLGEAGGEAPMGWAAVAHVMKRRADSGLWGDPFNGGLTNAIRAPKQFTVWNPGNEAGARAMRYQTSDPLYQRVGQVVDGVFGGQIPDPTGGATNYYALKGMETGQPPDWAGGGTNVRQIGNHTFMTLPLNAGPNAGRTYAQPSVQPYAPQPVNTSSAGDSAYSRNSRYVTPGNHVYNTPLSPQEEQDFRGWVKSNNVPFNPDAPVSDYDMRGFYRALSSRDPRATSAIDPNDNRLHYPDYWKTPYHQTFSNQSQWATPDAPRWNNQDQLIDSYSGRVIFDDRQQQNAPAQPSVQPGAQPYAPPPAQGINTPIAGSQASAPNLALQYLASVSQHPSRLGDTSNMHPEMVNRLAGALQDANNQGLNLTMMSGYRDPMETWNQGRRDSAAYYDASGKSSHSYGIAADVGGLDGPNGPKTQAWAQIAARYGLYNPYGTGNAAEFNHWQLLPYALETNPQQLAALKAAMASGQGMSAVWNVAMPVQGTMPYLGTQTTGMAVSGPQQPASSAQPAPATGAPQLPQAQLMSTAAMVEQQAERQQASAMQSIANIGQQIAAPPPPPPPLQPQYPTAGQAPVESPGIQPTTAGDSSSSASPDQPALSPPSAPAGAFDPFKYRKQPVAFPSGVSATPT